MTTISQASTYNVEATLNNHFRTQLAAVTRPSWLATMPAITSSNPEAAANLPAFSLYHLPVGVYDKWQGRAVGEDKQGAEAVAIMEINAWVSRRDADWQAKLRTMRDMVETVYINASNASVIIKDYAANRASPSDTSYLIRLDKMAAVQTAPDPNPDIERVRVLITYSWIYRS